ncbi:MAG: ArgE/DapE family deacylase [Anaerolineae bacterium]
MTHDIVQLLSQLVAINSINPDLVPDGAGETEIAAFVAQWCRAAGLEVEIDEAAVGRPNVIAVARGSGGGRSLLLNAHMDTVGVAGMDHPHEPEIKGNRLYGRGSYDMKAGLAAILMVAAQAKQLNLRGDVIVTAVCDEEYASIGTASVVKRVHADAAIVTEATAMDICTAHKGFIWLEIETQGKAAHGSEPSLGVDAIAKMGSVLVGLEALGRELQAAPSHPLLGAGSIHASLIIGGQELSSYPERCVLSVERRTVPGESPELVSAQVQQILDRSGNADPQFKAALRTLLVRDYSEIAADAPIVQLLQQHIVAAGRQPKIFGAPWWMDSAILSAAGIPTVIFGPGGEGAHAVEEWVDLDQVRECADILLKVVQDFCG